MGGVPTKEKECPAGAAAPTAEGAVRETIKKRLKCYRANNLLIVTKPANQGKVVSAFALTCILYVRERAEGSRFKF
jgi:hypothetical protein